MLTIILILLALRLLCRPVHRPMGMFWGMPCGHRRPPMGGMGFGPYMGRGFGHGPFFGPRGWF